MATKLYANPLLEAPITDPKHLVNKDYVDTAVGEVSGVGMKKYTETITGDGETESFTIEHGLASLDVITRMKDSENNEILAEVTDATENALTIHFGTALEDGYEIHVIVLG